MNTLAYISNYQFRPKVKSSTAAQYCTLDGGGALVSLQNKSAYATIMLLG
jgi:hypothetical protein